MKYRVVFLVISILLLVSTIVFYSKRLSIIPSTNLITTSHQSINTQSLRGKVLIINFWASSCTGCIEEMHKLRILYQHFFKKNFTIITIAMQYDPPNYALNYIHQHRLPFLNVIDYDGKLAQLFGNIRLTPTTILVDKEGKIREKIIGNIKVDLLAQKINQLL